jgi:hypothetical protein
MKKDSKSINVYWAPHSIPAYQSNTMVENWNMLYQDPYSLLQYWAQFDLKEAKEDSFIKCPAFQNLAKNTYAWNWPIDSSYKYRTSKDFSGIDSIEILPTTKEFLAISPPREQTLSSGPSVETSFKLNMFAEEPLEIMLTGPYLHHAEYMKSGFLGSGQFDIGQWFRPISTEIQLNGSEGELNFKKDEPILYIKFLTDKKINLQRFEFTQELATYSRQCILAKTIFGMRMTLPESYAIFNKSRTREIVLKKIKENLV